MPPRNGCLVLTYHRITDAPDLEDSLCVSRNTFDNQMAYLREHYTVLSGEQVASMISSRAQFPPGSCLITFDDGWADNYSNAYPILLKHDLPATIFLATDFIGSNKRFWHSMLEEVLFLGPEHRILERLDALTLAIPDVIPRLKAILHISAKQRRKHIYSFIEFMKGKDRSERELLCQEVVRMLGEQNLCITPAMLSWEQVREMSRKNVSFGAHTHTHALLTQLQTQEITNELYDSKVIIESQISKTVQLFCYPNGDYNQCVVELTEKAGYVAAFTCDPGINLPNDPPFELKRMHVLESMSVTPCGKYMESFFAAELSGVRRLLKSQIKGNRSKILGSGQYS